MTFGLGLDGSIWTLIWMWKEFLIIILTIFVVWFLARKVDKTRLENMREEFPLKTFVFIFFVTVLVAFIISMFNSNIANFVLSMRYSMFGFFIFVLFFVISYLFFDKKSQDLVVRYNKIIKRILL